MDTLIDRFVQWTENNQRRLKDDHVEVTLTLPPRQNETYGVYVDIDTPKHIARVTLWNSGECDQEILAIESEQTIFWEHVLLTDEKRVDEMLEKFFVKIVGFG